MSDLANQISKEEREKSEALLKQFDTRSKTAVAEYVEQKVSPEIVIVKKSMGETEQRIKAIEDAQRAIDEAQVSLLNSRNETYKGIFNGTDEYRFKHGIAKPASGRILMAYLNAICKAPDGNAALKNLELYETKQGEKYFELQECFKAMGYTKGIMSVSSPQDGGFTVPTPVSMDVIEALYAATWFGKLGVIKMMMPNGNLTIPRIGEKSTSGYIGETRPAPKTSPKLDSLRMNSHKLAAYVAYSRDLFYASPIGIEGLIIRDLQRVLNLKKEYSAIYGEGTSSVPMGVDKIIPVTADYRYGGSSTAFTSDIPGLLCGYLEAKNVLTEGIGWLMHPMMYRYIWNLKSTTGQFIFRDELEKGRLAGYPVATTTQIKYTNTGTYSTSSSDIWLGNWQELIVGQARELEIVVSDNTTFTDDTGTVINTLESDLIGIRVLDCHDFCLRHNESFLQGTYKFATS